MHIHEDTVGSCHTIMSESLWSHLLADLLTSPNIQALYADRVLVSYIPCRTTAMQIFSHVGLRRLAYGRTLYTTGHFPQAGAEGVSTTYILEKKDQRRRMRLFSNTILGNICATKLPRQ